MKASQRIYRTADGTIVAEDDSRAAFLVAPEGGDVDEEYVKAAKAFFADGGEDDDEADEVEGKAAAKPVDKAVKKSANK